MTKTRMIAVVCPSSLSYCCHDPRSVCTRAPSIITVIPELGVFKHWRLEVKRFGEERWTKHLMNGQLLNPFMKNDRINHQ
jgi:hypothetical protein